MFNSNLACLSVRSAPIPTQPRVSISVKPVTSVRAERCLGIEKVLPLDLNPLRTHRERIRATVATHIQENPDATLQELIDHVCQEHGVTFKPPAMCVIRQQLSLVPDTQQSRAAKVRRSKRQAEI